jgi:hypothetical protein
LESTSFATRLYKALVDLESTCYRDRAGILNTFAYASCTIFAAYQIYVNPGMEVPTRLEMSPGVLPTPWVKRGRRMCIEKANNRHNNFPPAGMANISTIQDKSALQLNET